MIIQQKGVTLLEAILVMAIASSIMLMGFRMYTQLRLTANLQQLQTNIDMIFQAAAQYYVANCQHYGALDPTTDGRPWTAPSAPALTAAYAVTISDLQAGGFLTQAPAPLPITDNTYTISFMPSLTNGSVNTRGCIDANTSCTITDTDIPTSQAQSLIWHIQVTTKIKDVTKLSVYQGATAADATIDGNILMWNRLPSNAALKMQTPQSGSLFQLRMFNLQYSHDQMYELNSGYASPQNYLCGG